MTLHDIQRTLDDALCDLRQVCDDCDQALDRARRAYRFLEKLRDKIEGDDELTTAAIGTDADPFK